MLFQVVANILAEVEEVNRTNTVETSSSAEGSEPASSALSENEIQRMSIHEEEEAIPNVLPDAAIPVIDNEIPINELTDNESDYQNEVSIQLY